MFSIFSKVRNDSWVRTKLQNNWILILFLMGRTTQHNGPNPSFSSCAPARNPRMEPAAGKFGALPHTTRLLRWKRRESQLAMNRRPLNLCLLTNINFWKRFIKHFKMFQTYEKVPQILLLFHKCSQNFGKSFLEHFKLFQTSQMVQSFQTQQNVPKQFWNVFILMNIWNSSKQLWNAEERNNLNSLKQVRMGKNI